MTRLPASAVLLLLFLASAPGLCQSRSPPSGWNGPAPCVFSPAVTKPHGTWFDGVRERCYCNNGQWEQCRPLATVSRPAPPPAYNPPVYSPPVDRPAYNPPADRPVYNPPVFNLSPVYNPPVYNPPVYEPPTYYQNCGAIKHGSWGATDFDRKVCYCNDGKLELCENIPSQGCEYNNYYVDDGEYIDTDRQRCQCREGRLQFCTDLCQAGRMQLMFLFDTSTSIKEDDDGESESEVGRENWEAMKSFTADVVRGVPVGYNAVQIGYTSFADRPETRISFSDSESTNKNALLRSLGRWYPKIKGQTYLARAMRHSRDLYDYRDNSAKVLVILTDGNADDNIRRISEEMRNQGFIIWAIGVGNAIEFDQLYVLAGDGSRVLQVRDFNSLAGNLDFLRNAVCQDYGSYSG